jgi:hypothetical protein
MMVFLGTEFMAFVAKFVIIFAVKMLYYSFFFVAAFFSIKCMKERKKNNIKYKKLAYKSRAAFLILSISCATSYMKHLKVKMRANNKLCFPAGGIYHAHEMREN